MESATLYSSPFIIDMEHELALFIYNEVKSNAVEPRLNAEELTGATKSITMQNVLMRKAHYICSRSDEKTHGNTDKKCAMYAKPMGRSHCVSKFQTNTCEK